jgi:hypothetical protein
MLGETAIGLPVSMIDPGPVARHRGGAGSFSRHRSCRLFVALGDALGEPAIDFRLKPSNSSRGQRHGLRKFARFAFPTKMIALIFDSLFGAKLLEDKHFHGPAHACCCPREQLNVA